MKQKIKILHLEDTPADAELVARELIKAKINPEIVVVANKAKFIKALKDFSYDIILSDHSLASFDSHEALRLVKKAGITVPFILVTAAMTDEFAAAIMKEGATDYILKDRLNRLPSAIINSIERHDWEEQQRTARERLAFHIENTPLGFIEWDSQLYTKTLSHQAEEIFGWTLEEFLQNQRNGFSQVYEEDLPIAIKALEDLVTGRVQRNSTQHRNITKDGKVIWCEWFNSVLKDKDGKIVSIMSLVQDITANKVAEEKLNKANRLYTFISQINQSIVRIKDETALFRAVCSIALEFGTFKIAWIGLFNDLKNEISIVYQNGIPDDKIKQFEGVPVKKDGPQAHVLRSGKHFCCNDIANDPGLESWKSLANKYDIHSCMVLPVKKSGNIIGTFNLYSSKINFYDKEEIELLLEVTGDISFALDTFEKEKKHKAAEELVLQNEKLFRALIENSADMITLGNREGELIYGSPSITTVLGYSPKELINMSLFDVVHPDDMPELLETRNKLLKNPGKSFNFQHRRRHKNGGWVWCEGTFINMLDEPGINAVVTNFRDISEKKSADEQQEFDKNNLDALINSTNDLMWSVDRSFKIITSNKPFNTIIQLISGKTVAAGINILEAAFSTEESERYKVYYQRAFAGESFREVVNNEALVDSWSENSYHPIRQGDEIIGTACHSQDITDKIKAEKALLLTQFAIDNASDAVFWMTADARIVKVNVAACVMLGYSQTEMMQLSIPDIDPYFNAENWLAHYEELRQKGSLFFETIQRANDGRLIPVEISANYIKFGDSEFNCAFSRDISERKIAEGNLVKSETKLKEAQAIAHIGNFEIDLTNYSEVWSDEMYRIIGINKEEATASTELFLSFIHPDDLNHIKTGFEENLRTFENSTFDFRFIRDDGRLRYGYTKARFEFDKNRNPTRIFGIFQDVTEVKLAEIERIKMVNDLMLRNTELEQFGYIISHNLRAPVTNIIGASGVLNDPGLCFEDKETLNSGIKISAMRLDSVIKDLNKILEIKGDIGATKEKVRFSALIDNIRDSIRDLVDKYGIEIKYDFSAVNEFLTLRAYLYSIFYNLITNSIKYRRQQVHCVIGIKSTMIKNRLELIFTDNGTGIDLKKNGGDVFGLYKRFHNNIEGKGMGLFMVKTQVETLGGKISIQSKENVGTEFKIEFEV